MKPAKTIAEVFRQFLDEQEARVSGSTFSKYESVINLLEAYLERYWPGHEGVDYDRITKAGGTYCGAFGPEEIPGALGEFFGYFMPRKVIASQGTVKAAGTVTKKLMKWLAQKGHVEDAEALEAGRERAKEATRNLSAGQQFRRLQTGDASQRIMHRATSSKERRLLLAELEERYRNAR